MRVIASVLALALIHGAFAPQAWAQVVSIGAMNAPVGGSAAAAATNVPGTANSFSPAMTLSNSGLTSTLSAPAIAPAPLRSAVPSALAAQASAAPSANTTRFAAAPAALTPTAVSIAAAKDAAPKADGVPAAGKAASSETGPITLSAGLRTGRVANKASAIISGVRAFFGGKSVEAVPAAKEAIVSGTLSAAHASELEPSPAANAENSQTLRPAAVNEPPAPEQPKQPGSKGKGWFGLGATVAALIGGMLVMQLGLEAQGAAMAQLTEDAFGDFSILAQVAIFASIGSMVGQQLAKFFSDRFGLTKTFYAAHIFRAVSLATMVFLLGTGHMALPLMFVFYALNGMVTGIAATAQGTLQKFLLAEQGVSQQKFRTWWQFLAEVFGVLAPMVLGALVVSVGAGWITAIYPATIVLALMLFLMLKVIPLSAAKRIETMIAKAGNTAAATAATAAPEAPNAPKVGAWQKVKDAFKQIFNNMEEGKDFVFKNPVLKYSLAGAAIFDLMNVLIYRLITPGYGKLVAGSAGMAAIQGNLVGMFSFGGLILAAVFLVLEKRDKKKNEGKTPDELIASERSSMLRWTLLGIPALALLGVMAFNLVLPFAPLMFLDINWVPSTVFAAALIPFGFMQVAASIKLNSFFQERLPSDSGKVQKALAFSGSAMTALSIVLMLALKPLFSDIAAFNPFPYLAMALIPVGVALFFLQRKLANATKPENIKLAEDAPDQKSAGGFVGILLGVIAAALLLSFMAFIPGVAPLLAGLGVLGKFALNLGVALAIPAAGWFADRALRKRSAPKP
jgi:MFS family permease